MRHKVSHGHILHHLPDEMQISKGLSFTLWHMLNLVHHDRTNPHAESNRVHTIITGDEWFHLALTTEQLGNISRS